MKRVSWITADCFVDTDLPVLTRLKDSYQIYWQIVVSYAGGVSYNEYVKLLIPDPGENLVIEFVYEKHRRRDPRMFFSDLNVLRRAKSFHPDFYYVSGFMLPWGLPLIPMILPVDKVVMACHNVSTPKGAVTSGWSSASMAYVLRRFKNFQVFSNSQRLVLESRVTGKNVLECPHALSDFGKPDPSVSARGDDLVRFLSFGIIREYKRIDLLIEAGNILAGRGYHNFRILIAGNCPDWGLKYAQTIKYPEVFELDIRRIPNEEVASLFAKSDYFVMPYQDIAQSGAMTVAFQYNLPVIVSDIPQFKEFVQDGKTGLCFKTEDPVALADKMQYVLENHRTIYAELKHNQQVFVQDYLSLDSIVSRYREFFDRL